MTTTILRQTLTGPSAWRGADLAGGDSWIWPLSDSDVNELEAALAVVKRRRLRPGEFGREHFPLESLGPRLGAILEELEDGRGFVLVRGLPVARYDLDDLLRLYWGLGVWLGQPMPQRAVLNLSGIRDDAIAHITDQGYDIRGRNVHGSATRAEQLPHVDPADVVGLLCVRPAKAGGLSRIASAATIHNEILSRHPEYLEVLYRGFPLDLRGEVRAGVDAEVTPEPVPVFTHFAGKVSINFNARMIETGMEKLGRTLSDLERAAVDEVVALARDPGLRLDMDFQPGDIQLLNNYEILHYRTGWEDHEDPLQRRLLLRLWLNVTNGRPLAPAFHGEAPRVTKHDITRRPTDARAMS
jgi:hypothetical protein